MNNFKYVIVGGDARFAYLADAYVKEEKNVKAIFAEDFNDILGNENIDLNWKQCLKNSDVVIFPLPIAKNDEFLNTKSENKIKLQEIIKEISSEKIVLGGAISQNIKEMFEQKNIKIIDYFAREELAILNAVPTVEGAVEIAMKNLPITIYGSNCLVTGFGRVAKAMAKILKALQANVTVVARKIEDLTYAKVYGCRATYISNLSDVIKEQDLIVNTVPSLIIDESVLKNISNECLIIDLASKPGGVDFEKAKEMNRRVEWALALPGKVAPKTSGEIIKKVIDNILIEF